MHWQEWASGQEWFIRLILWQKMNHYVITIYSRTQDPASLNGPSLEACIEKAQKVYGGPQ